MNDSTMNVPLKRCIKCERALPFSDEYFFKDKTRIDGYFPYCKECKGFSFTFSLIPLGFKQCSKCKKVLPFSDFSKQAKGQHGLRAGCKECECQSNKDYRDNNQNVVRLWRANNKEKTRKNSKKWKLAHPEKRREGERKRRKKNAERNSKRSSLWKKKNPHKNRLQNQRRMARTRSLPDTLTHSEWLACLEYFHGCCAVCGKQCNDLFKTHVLAADHWIPLSSPNCPGTVAANIIPLCHGQNGCNNSKSDKDAETWLIEKFGKRKTKEILERIKAYFRKIIA